MSLQMAPIHVNFGEGVDTFTDQKAVVSTKLLKAQNVVFTAPGSLRTRFGWQLENTYADGLRLAKHGDEPVVFTSSHLLPGSSSASTWVSDMAGIQMTPVVRESGQVATDVDMAIVGDVALTVCLLVKGIDAKITVVVSDLPSGRTVRRHDRLTPADARSPKCVAVGDSIWIFWVDSTGLNGIRYHVSTDVVDAPLLCAGAPIQLYDVCPLSSSDFLLAVQGAALDVFRLSEAFVPLSGSTLAVSTSTNIALMGTTGETAYLAYKNDTSGNLECAGFALPALTPLFGPIAIKAPYPTFFTHPEIVIGRVNGTSARVIYRDQTASGTDDVETIDVDNTGALSGASVTYRRRIQSKPWTQAGVMRMLVGFPSDLQGTSYVMAVSGGQQLDGIVARNLSGIEMVGSLPAVPETSTPGVYLVPLLTKQKVVAERIGGDFFYTNESVGVDHLRLDFVSRARFCTAELGGLTYIAGGMVRVYDGNIVSEAGFLQFPIAPVVNESAGGAVTAGNHDYLVVWSYTDAKGNVHRSAPSPASSETIAPGNQTVTLAQVDPLNMSMRENAFSGTPVGRVLPEWYGTLADSAEPFYRIQPPGDSPINQPDQEFALAFLTPTTEQDSLISNNPTLYTSGSTLANFPPPSTDCLVTHKNRVVLISAEDGRIWFSKEYIVGEAPGFNDALTFALPTAERPTAMASFDDKLVIWTANEIHVLTGTFPNDTGAGLNLNSSRIASDVGAIDWRAITVVPQGAFFASVKGIFLLTRGMAVQFAGADVAYWTDNYADIVASVVTPDRDEIRFHVRSPVAPVVAPLSQTLVLNFRAATQASPYGQWSTFDDSLGDALSSVVVAGTVYKLTDTGALYSETLGFSDDGAWITVEVETANIYPFGRQASARFRSATVLGRAEGTHAIQLEVAYDDDPVFVESAFFSAADLAVIPREQPSHHLRFQKGAGVRVRITTYQDGASPNAGVTLSGLVLEAAQRRGSADRGLPKEARQ